MDFRTDNERLLNDVLSGDDAAFRERLLGKTLQVARRRRRLRQVGRAMTGLALVLAIGLLFWRILPPKIGGPSAKHRSYVSIRTRPLPAAALVMTRPQAVKEFATASTEVTVVTTASTRRVFREIDDRELLTSVPPAVLVRQGPHAAELVFVNAIDKEQWGTN